MHDSPLPHSVVGNAVYLAAGAMIMRGNKVGMITILMGGAPIVHAIGDASDFTELASDLALIAAISSFAPPAIKVAANVMKILWFGKQLKPMRDVVVQLKKSEILTKIPKHAFDQVKDTQAWAHISKFLGENKVKDVNPFTGKGMHYHLEEWTREGQVIKPDTTVNVLKTKTKAGN